MKKALPFLEKTIGNAAEVLFFAAGLLLLNFPYTMMNIPVFGDSFAALVVVFSGLILLVYLLFGRDKRRDWFLFGILLLFGYLSVSFLLSHNDLRNTLQAYFLYPLAITALFSVFLRRNLDRYLKVTFFLYGAITLINAYTLFAYRDIGMPCWPEMNIAYETSFVGNINNTLPYVIITFFTGVLLSVKISGWYLLPSGLSLLVSILAADFTNSVTQYYVFLLLVPVFFAALLLVFFPKAGKFFKPFNAVFFLAAILAAFVLIVVIAPSGALSGIGIDEGVHGRTKIYEKVFEDLKTSPIFGMRMPGVVTAEGYRLGHAHNTFLEVAHIGGAVGLILFLLLLGVAVLRLLQVPDLRCRFLLAALFGAFMIGCQLEAFQPAVFFSVFSLIYYAGDGICREAAAKEGVDPGRWNLWPRIRKHRHQILFDLSMLLVAALAVLAASVLERNGLLPEIIKPSFSFGQFIAVAAASVALGMILFPLYGKLRHRQNPFAIPVFVLIFGTMVAVMSPVMNGYDEQSHFYKTVASLDGKTFDYDSYSYEMSDSIKMIFENRFSRWYDSIYRGDFFESKTKLDAAQIAYAQPTYPTYGYLFCMAGFGVGKLLRLPVGLTFLLGRLANVFGFALMTLAAILLLPKAGRSYYLAFGLFACFPGVLFVVGNYSQDSVVYGLCMILVALFLRMRTHTEKFKLWEYVWFGVLLILMAPLKLPYICLGFLLFLIPKEKFPFEKKNLWIGVLAGVTLLAGLLWTLLVSSQYHETRVEGVDGAGQVLFLLTHPFTALYKSVGTIVVLFVSYLDEAFRISGDFADTISRPLCVIFSSLTGLLLLFAVPRIKTKGFEKPAVFGIAVGISILTAVAMMINFNPVGMPYYVLGLQGRYFYGIMVLLPLMLPTKIRLPHRFQQSSAFRKGVVGFIIAEGCFFLMCMGLFL